MSGGGWAGATWWKHRSFRLLHVLLFGGHFFYDQLCYSSTQVGTIKLKLCKETRAALGHGSGVSAAHGEDKASPMDIELEMPTPQKPWVCSSSKENPFLLSLTASVGGQKQVCVNGHTRVINFSNKQLLQLHQPWCCAGCFPSFRNTWMRSCPCSATLGWRGAPSGSDARLVSTPGCYHSHFGGD